MPSYFPKQDLKMGGRGHQTRPQDDEREGSKAATDIFDRNTLLSHAGKTKEPWSSSEQVPTVHSGVGEKAQVLTGPKASPSSKGQRHQIKQRNSGHS